MFDTIYVKVLALFAQVNPSCDNSFFGIPTWFKYLKVRKANACAPELRGINDIWLIGLAMIEILTRLAVLVAVGFIVYAGIKYSNSRGNAEKVNSAKFTLQDAFTGLLLAIVASAAVSFIAGRLTS